MIPESLGSNGCGQPRSAVSCTSEPAALKLDSACSLYPCSCAVFTQVYLSRRSFSFFLQWSMEVNRDGVASCSARVFRQLLPCAKTALQLDNKTTLARRLAALGQLIDMTCEQDASLTALLMPCHLSAQPPLDTAPAFASLLGWASTSSSMMSMSTMFAWALQCWCFAWARYSCRAVPRLQLW